jgi:hypothetical protein
VLVDCGHILLGLRSVSGDGVTYGEEGDRDDEQVRPEDRPDETKRPPDRDPRNLTQPGYLSGPVLSRRA